MTNSTVQAAFIIFILWYVASVASFRMAPLCSRPTLRLSRASSQLPKTFVVRLSSENNPGEIHSDQSAAESTSTENVSTVDLSEDVLDNSVVHPAVTHVDDGVTDSNDSYRESDCPCGDFGCADAAICSTNESNGSDDSRQEQVDGGSLAVEYRRTFARLRDRDYRRRMYRNIHTGFSSVLRHLLRNIREGELGKRGEEWVVTQGLLVFSILGGVHPIFRSLLFLSGLLSSVSGVHLMAHALSDLGELTTPFAPPVQASVVVENGVYRLVRHPMYGGLLLFCGGLSILSGAVEKLVLTLGLAWLLVSAWSPSVCAVQRLNRWSLTQNKQADLEEELLLRRHGEVYLSYMADKKKLVPLLF